MAEILKRKQAFTLVEMMIVVAIIGMLAAIAVPSFIRARETSQQNACINNLRQISYAKDVYALENSNVTPANMSELVSTYIKRAPDCPSGGTYTLGVLSADATCDFAANHTL